MPEEHECPDKECHYITLDTQKKLCSHLAETVEWREKVNKKFDVQKSWMIASLTALSLNLLGVIVLLIVSVGQ